MSGRQLTTKSHGRNSTVSGLAQVRLLCVRTMWPPHPSKMRLDAWAGASEAGRMLVSGLQKPYNARSPQTDRRYKEPRMPEQSSSRRNHLGSQRIDENGPGSVLIDFEALLGFVEDGVRSTGKSLSNTLASTMRRRTPTKWQSASCR
jgi:hypothetical protein